MTMNCKYCDLKYESSKKIKWGEEIKLSNSMFLRILEKKFDKGKIYNGNFLHVDIENFDSEYFEDECAEIKYCPFCGRKL